MQTWPLKHLCVYVTGYVFCKKGSELQFVSEDASSVNSWCWRLSKWRATNDTYFLFWGRHVITCMFAIQSTQIFPCSFTQCVNMGVQEFHLEQKGAGFRSKLGRHVNPHQCNDTPYSSTHTLLSHLSPGADTLVLKSLTVPRLSLINNENLSLI